jgi:hypothetical protein
MCSNTGSVAASGFFPPQLCLCVVKLKTWLLSWEFWTSYNTITVLNILEFNLYLKVWQKACQATQVQTDNMSNELHSIPDFYETPQYCTLHSERSQFQKNYFHTVSYNFTYLKPNPASCMCEMCSMWRDKLNLYHNLFIKSTTLQVWIMFKNFLIQTYGNKFTLPYVYGEIIIFLFTATPYILLNFLLVDTETPLND